MNTANQGLPRLRAESVKKMSKLSKINLVFVGGDLSPHSLDLRVGNLEVQHHKHLLTSLYLIYVP